MSATPKNEVLISTENFVNGFEYYNPTRIVFGRGALTQVGDIVSRYGRRALLVTVPEFPELGDVFARATSYMESAGVAVHHFDGVAPNPTTHIVSKGSRMAKEVEADVVVGIGGGSSIDTAKAIAVEATHEGAAWDYLFYKAEPSQKTLPIIAVSTTSGTGSQATPCAVLTRTEDEDKSAIWHDNIYPRVAIVDPDLPSTMPARLTSVTGFDAFCHSFEAYISRRTNPHVKAIALSAIGLVAKFLPRAVNDGGDASARDAMSWADTAGGVAFSSAGVALPHGVGMQISGHCPGVTHGESLAAQYPSFTRFTWQSAIEDFAAVGRILDPSLITAGEAEAAEGCCTAIDDFLKRIGLWIDLRSLGVRREKLRAIADAGQVLPDYLNNPRIATIEDIYELLIDSYDRDV